MAEESSQTKSHGEIFINPPQNLENSGTPETNLRSYPQQVNNYNFNGSTYLNNAPNGNVYQPIGDSSKKGGRIKNILFLLIKKVVPPGWLLSLKDILDEINK